MNIIEITKPAFFVIGKEGYGNTVEGNQWIIDLWQDANQHFLEVFDLASRDEQDHLRGFWGAMTDSTRSFLPWKDLREGYYLAGVEVFEEAVAPKSWTKWQIPSFRYLSVKVEDSYQEVMDYVLHYYMKANGLSLSGAIQEHMNPEENGQLTLFFPIQRITAN